MGRDRIDGGRRRRTVLRLNANIANMPRPGTFQTECMSSNNHLFGFYRLAYSLASTQSIKFNSMSPPRFYAPQLAQFYNSPHFHSSLEAAEARHAASVLRIRAGQTIELFDGVGHQATASVVSVTRHDVEFTVDHWSTPLQDLAHELTLAIALPKGDRQKTLVDAATELGVSRLVPLLTQRGVAQPTDNALERLSRGVIEACKQSGRNRLMKISDPRSIDQLTSESWMQQPPECPEILRLIAHPYAANDPLVNDLVVNDLAVSDQMPDEVPRDDRASHHQPGRPPSLHRVLADRPPCPAVIVIGPEGGLSDDEINRAVATGWRTVSLGNTILRIEVAALAAAAQLTAWLQSHDAG